jgi:DNA repair protein RadA/Sms
MDVISSSKENQNFKRAEDVQIPEIYNRRFKTGVEGVDELFGGAGFMPNFTFTLAAAPGTGKTSILLQILELLEKTGKKTVYISGEENVEQLAFTCKRLNVSKVPLANLTDIDEIIKEIIANKFDFVVIDSLPSISCSTRMNRKELEEYITTKIVKTAKDNEIVIGVILHFTKTGTYKGSTLLPHSVDCNIIMTRNEDDYNLRDVDVTKNRFGTAGQATFEMTASGFTFEALNEEVDVSSNKKSSRSSNADDVQAILDTPKTSAQIQQETDVSLGYLPTLLRLMVNAGKIEKIGKGSEAVYVNL